MWGHGSAFPACASLSKAAGQSDCFHRTVKEKCVLRKKSKCSWAGWRPRSRNIVTIMQRRNRQGLKLPDSARATACCWYIWCITRTAEGKVMWWWSWRLHCHFQEAGLDSYDSFSYGSTCLDLFFFNTARHYFFNWTMTDFPSSISLSSISNRKIWNNVLRKTVGKVRRTWRAQCSVHY